MGCNNLLINNYDSVTGKYSEKTKRDKIKTLLPMVRRARARACAALGWSRVVAHGCWQTLASRRGSGRCVCNLQFTIASARAATFRARRRW